MYLQTHLEVELAFCVWSYIHTAASTVVHTWLTSLTVLFSFISTNQITFFILFSRVTTSVRYVTAARRF